jgi:2-amino-4-hydroxy-6-hydroxymethyldihydropteridine diphosphokinase
VEVGLSLGSNIGDRLANLSEAKRRILAQVGVALLAKSPVYETEPVGVKPEYRDMPFLNAILVIESPCAEHECLHQLKKIEDALGRRRGLDPFAPRPIDIDIVYAGTRRIASGGLVLPHPHWSERRFVVEPLADVRPDLILPGTDHTVAEVLRGLPRNKAVTLLTRDW